jgi:hypothetical protein
MIHPFDHCILLGGLCLGELLYDANILTMFYKFIWQMLSSFIQSYNLDQFSSLVLYFMFKQQEFDKGFTFFSQEINPNFSWFVIYKGHEIKQPNRWFD